TYQNPRARASPQHLCATFRSALPPHTPERLSFRHMSRKKPHALTLFPAFAAIVALTFTGCSSGGKDTTAAEEGPLSKYLSALWDGEEWTQEKYDEQNKQTEELVAVCM